MIYLPFRVLRVVGSSLVLAACKEGTFSNRTDLDDPDDCTVTDVGFFAPTGSMEPFRCAAGTIAPFRGLRACIQCIPGKYQNAMGAAACKACRSGHYCLAGASAPLPCLGGSYSNGTSLTKPSDCDICDEGHFCAAGSAKPLRCFPGTYAPRKRMELCSVCPEGSFQRSWGATGCEQEMKEIVKYETVVQKPLVLDMTMDEYDETTIISDLASLWSIPADVISLDELSAGSLQLVALVRANSSSMMAWTRAIDAVGDSTLSEWLKVNVTSQPATETQINVTQMQASGCLDGSYCPSGAAAPIPCPAGTHSDPNAEVMSSENHCVVCDLGVFCPVGSSVAIACSAGTYNDQKKQESCRKCEAGTFQAHEGATACDACTQGHFCMEGASAAIPCPAGTYGNGTDLKRTEHCLPVLPGFFSIIGSAEPEQCRPGTFASSYRNSVCHTCPQGKFTNSSGTTNCTICPAGFWCPANIQIPCSENQFNSKPGGYEITHCTRCPDRTTTRGKVGVVSSSDCSCSADYYLAPEGMNLTTVHMKAACVERCCTCPIGSDCKDEAFLPITLADLPIMAGYYRLSSNQYDVRRCPDANADCPMGLSSCANSTSGCRGGRDMETLCQPGLNGTFCRACISPSEYYVSAEQGIVAHCEPCENAVANGLDSAIGVVLLIGGVIVLLCAVLQCLRMRGFHFERLWRNWKAALEAIHHHKVPDMLKILIGFYQIASRVEDVYEIYLPPDVRLLLQQLKIAISLGIEGVPLSCIGANGYMKRLQFWMFAPIVLVALATLTVLTHLLVMAIKKGSTGAGRVENNKAVQVWPSFTLILKSVMPAVLRIAFLMYPIVTNVAFEAFSCFWFEDGTGFLITDVSIECDTPEHTSAKVWASLAIFIYPVGLFVLNAVLLYGARKAIKLEENTSLSATLFFLHHEYQPDYFWWE